MSDGDTLRDDGRMAESGRRRWVVKIGSALLTANGEGLDAPALDAWVEQMAALRQQGDDVVLVSSGAVAEGMQRLGWQQRPTATHDLQAAAAVGQMGLINAYETRFQRFALKTAQVLLVHDDLSSRKRYINARHTLQRLLALGVVPVVNENDTVATEEIRFGDNDSLAGLVANLIDATALLILTDQVGVCDADPRDNPDAKVIAELDAHDKQLDAVAGGGGALGRGGMITKIRAARLAARSGAYTVIAHGHEPEVLLRLSRGDSVGTRLTTQRKPIAARKQWLAGGLPVQGTLHLDEGAVRVLVSSGKSLLPVGVRAIDGRFERGDLVRCVGPDGIEVARGLVNYSAEEAERIAGRRSAELSDLLGYCGDEEMIHRDDLVVA